jgi:hypothetical protein
MCVFGVCLRPFMEIGHGTPRSGPHQENENTEGHKECSDGTRSDLGSTDPPSLTQIRNPHSCGIHRATDPGVCVILNEHVFGLVISVQAPSRTIVLRILRLAGDYLSEKNIALFRIRKRELLITPTQVQVPWSQVRGRMPMGRPPRFTVDKNGTVSRSIPPRPPIRRSTPRVLPTPATEAKLVVQRDHRERGKEELVKIYHPPSHDLSGYLSGVTLFCAPSMAARVLRQHHSVEASLRVVGMMGAMGSGHTCALCQGEWAPPVCTNTLRARVASGIFCTICTSIVVSFRRDQAAR